MALTREYIKSRLGLKSFWFLGKDFSDEEEEDRGPWFREQGQKVCEFLGKLSVLLANVLERPALGEL